MRLYYKRMGPSKPDMCHRQALCSPAGSHCPPMTASQVLHCLNTSLLHLTQQHSKSICLLVTSASEALMEPGWAQRSSSSAQRTVRLMRTAHVLGATVTLISTCYPRSDASLNLMSRFCYAQNPSKWVTYGVLVVFVIKNYIRQHLSFVVIIVVICSINSFILSAICICCLQQYTTCMLDA